MPFGVSGSPSGYSIGSYAPGGRSTVVPNREQDDKRGSNYRNTPYDQKVHGGNSGNPSSNSSSTGSNRSGSSAPTATDAVARQQLEQKTKENAQLKADLESSNKALAV